MVDHQYPRHNPSPAPSPLPCFHVSPLLPPSPTPLGNPKDMSCFFSQKPTVTHPISSKHWPLLAVGSVLPSYSKVAPIFVHQLLVLHAVYLWVAPTFSHRLPLLGSHEGATASAAAARLPLRSAVAPQLSAFIIVTIRKWLRIFFQWYFCVHKYEYDPNAGLFF